MPIGRADIVRPVPHAEAGESLVDPSARAPCARGQLPLGELARDHHREICAPTRDTLVHRRRLVVLRSLAVVDAAVFIFLPDGGAAEAPPLAALVSLVHPGTRVRAVNQASCDFFFCADPALPAALFRVRAAVQRVSLDLGGDFGDRSRIVPLKLLVGGGKATEPRA